MWEELGDEIGGRVPGGGADGGSAGRTARARSHLGASCPLPAQVARPTSLRAGMPHVILSTDWVVAEMGDASEPESDSTKEEEEPSEPDLTKAEKETVKEKDKTLKKEKEAACQWQSQLEGEGGSAASGSWCQWPENPSWTMVGSFSTEEKLRAERFEQAKKGAAMAAWCAEQTKLKPPPQGAGAAVAPNPQEEPPLKVKAPPQCLQPPLKVKAPPQCVLDELRRLAAAKEAAAKEAAAKEAAAKAAAATEVKTPPAA